MFASDEVRLDLSFDVAQARLASLALDWWLLKASSDAYGEGVTGLAKVGPSPDLSKLVRVHVQQLPPTRDRAGLAIRWEAAGMAGAMFPVLDADLTLTPAGDGVSTLAIAAAYRPPLGTVGAGLDRAILRRVATATVRVFLNRMAEAILDPAIATRPANGAAI